MYPQTPPESVLECLSPSTAGPQRACPFASLLSGLDGVRLSPDDLQQFQNNVLRQLRTTLCKAPVFTTREPGQNVLNRFKLSNPVETLLSRSVQRLRAKLELPVTVIWPTSTHQWWQLLLRHATEMQDRLFSQPRASHDPERPDGVLLPLVATAPPVACPECGVYFATQIHMRRHRSQSQPKQTTPALRQQFMQHALRGTPQCKHCESGSSAIGIGSFSILHCRVVRDSKRGPTHRRVRPLQG